eukprot:evm.model.scf_2655.2 EVM.evm.TU.scf_2655.2   scf_2655:3992-6131(-)
MSKAKLLRPCVGRVLPSTHWRTVGLRTTRPSLRSGPRPRSVRVCAGFFDDLDKWRRELKTKWRAAKFAAADKTEEAKSRMMEGPVIVKQFIFLVQQVVDAVAWLWSNFGRMLEEFVFGYDDFCLQETKRVWQFKTEHADEMRFWGELLKSAYAFLVTLVYQLLVPPGIVRSVLIPVFVGFAVYDRWFTSPMALAVLVMAPFKFWPGCPVTWL